MHKSAGNLYVASVLLHIAIEIKLYSTDVVYMHYYNMNFVYLCINLFQIFYKM